MSKQLTAAAVVVMIAMTPTWVDSWQLWDHPEKFQDGVTTQQIRTALLIWYLLLIFVALSSWRLFVND